MRRNLSVLTAVVCFGNAASAQLVFTQIANESGAGVTILTDPPPAVNESGDVVFVGESAGTQVLLVGNGGPLTTIDIATHMLRLVTEVRLDNAGAIAFTATRTCAGRTCRGAYSIDTSGSFAILLELPFPAPIGQPIVRPGIGLSPNGIVAFSSITDGSGALYRGPVTGPAIVLRAGSGQFFNTLRGIDVNENGTVAVQMEHRVPGRNFERGILLFDEPGQSFDTLRIAIAGLNVGQQPLPAINCAGTVAFRLGRPLPENPVVYKANPVGFFDAPDLTVIADLSGGYTDFRRVVINDNLVLFEAIHGMANFGIYSGQDPIANKIIEPGDSLEGNIVTSVVMGQLTNSGQLSVALTDCHDPRPQIWRIDNVM